MALTATAALPVDLALATAACSGASAASRGRGPRLCLAERLSDALGDASARGDGTAGRAREAIPATPRLPGDGAAAPPRAFCSCCLAAQLRASARRSRDMPGGPPPPAETSFGYQQVYRTAVGLG